MTRTQLEILLCDYADGTLDAAARAQVEAHLATHPLDRQLVDDAIEAKAFLESAEPVETPAELITRILFDIRHQEQPRQEEHERPWDRLRAWLRPVLQPRFAMGMAMTILSVSMFAQLLGIQLRQLTVQDLHPGAVYASVEDRAVRLRDRAEKFYEDLKFVYEMQSLLREWSAGTPSRSGPPAPAWEELEKTPAEGESQGREQQ